MNHSNTLRRTGWIVLFSILSSLSYGEKSVDAACEQNCRSATILSQRFWSSMRKTDSTIEVFRDGFSFSSQPGGTTTHLPALQAFNGQVFLAVRGTDPNGGVWTNRWTGSSWAGWTNPQNGSTTNSPDMSAFNNSVHLVVAGTDLPNRGLYLNRYTSAWLGYIGMSNLFTSSQTCASSSLRIGGCRTDGQCWRRTTTNVVTWTAVAVGDPCP